LDWLSIDLESPVWTAVAVVSDLHPERYAYPTTRSAWDTLSGLMSRFNDTAIIHRWRIDARQLTEKLLHAADDLLLRINDARAFHRAHDAHLARRSWFSSAFNARSNDEARLQQLTQALRAAPGALTVEPAIWEWADFWDCFWLCATGQIALNRQAGSFAPDAVAYCAIQALAPLARHLRQQPEQRERCDRRVRTMLEDNEDNAITAHPTVQYAFDQLGLRPFVETELVRMELEHRHHRRRRNSNEEEKPLTLLNGNPYKFPRKSSAP